MIVVGGLVIWSASRMPWTSSATGATGSQWYLSPGLFPAAIGGLLIIFSLRILVTAIKEGGASGIFASFSGWMKKLPRNRPIHRAILISVLLAVYIFGAVGRMNFLLASGGFIFITIALFWWPEAEGSFLRKFAITGVIAGTVPWVVTYLFSTFLYVPMP